ncbi:MAG: ABC transporter substrate-binding protein [Gammaproteobacteria bacterium]
MQPRILFFNLSAGFLLLASSAAATADETGAIAVVEKLHATLLEVMHNAEKLGFQGRYNVIAPVVESSFDTPLIAQVVLSRYWTELSPEKQQMFVALFNRLSASTYASRFDSFSGETFKTLNVEPMKKERLLVRTELTRKNDTPVKLEYLVQQNAGNWYIISVIADGVNDLALKRAEYATIINDRGFDSLVAEIEKKIHDLEAVPADS